MAKETIPVFLRTVPNGKKVPYHRVVQVSFVVEGPVNEVYTIANRVPVEGDYIATRSVVLTDPHMFEPFLTEEVKQIASLQ